MSDRAKAVRGRKRTLNKVHPPPSAADLFDSLMQGQEKADDPKPKTIKRSSLPKVAAAIEVKSSSLDEGDEGGISAAPAGGQGDQSDPSPSPRATSDDSEDEEAPVFITLSAIDATASPDQTPSKLSTARRPRIESTTVSTNETDEPSKKSTEAQNNGGDSKRDDVGEAEVMESDEGAPAPKDDSSAAEERGDGDSTEKSVQQKSRRSSDAGGVGSFGVSKDVEDSIRKEIENMLANNRLRNGGGAGDSELTGMNGHEAVDLEEDVILVEAERKRHCRFLIRRQEDQTLPSSRNYRCFKCSFSSSRMNNMVRHYRQC